MLESDFQAQGRFDCFGLSDAGAGENVNADQFLIVDFRELADRRSSGAPGTHAGRSDGAGEGHLLIVADGAGSGKAAQCASALAVEHVTDQLLGRFQRACRAGRGQPPVALDDFLAAIHGCRAKMKAKAASDDQFRCMSTTLTLACVVWPQLYLVHLGDSRCYLYRNGRLRRLTTDHTLAQKMAEAGVLDPARINASPWRNVLWKAIGGDGVDAAPDMHQIHLMSDDALLLCTSGLTKYVNDHQIAAALKELATPEQICLRLIGHASDSGGTENATVVVARLRDTMSR